MRNPEEKGSEPLRSHDEEGEKGEGEQAEEEHPDDHVSSPFAVQASPSPATSRSMSLIPAKGTMSPPRP